MAITGLETTAIAVPFREPYVTARGSLTHREIALVRVHTDEGPTGLGEAAALSLRGGAPLRTIVSELETRCSDALRGVDLSTLATAEPGRVSDAVAALLDSYGATNAQARAAVDLALHDLAGKLCGRPLWELLGAPGAEPVECNGTLVAGTPESVARRATELAQSGFTAVKVKARGDEDVETITAVRAAIGDDVAVRVDANGVWSTAEAIATLGELEPANLELAEQPAASIEELAVVRAAVRPLIVADESVGSAADARGAADAEACDAVTIKLAKVGGISPALAIAEILPSYLSSALDGPVGIAAAAHLAQSLPATGVARSLAHGLATAPLFATQIASVAAELNEGRLSPPPGPGLGVELDEAMVAQVAL